MDKPAALRKAEALEQHLAGNKIGAFVTLTDLEAWEFLNWLPTQLDPSVLDEYEFDLSHAKLVGNPWLVLDESFNIFGFGVARVADLH